VATPDRVVLGPHIYSIEYVEEIPGSKKRIGESHRISNRILVRNDQSESNLRSTTIHEIVHQAIWQSPMRFLTGWTDELEEALIVALEPHLLELFTRKENRPLRDWLSE
jgi:hypothetical protein